MLRLVLRETDVVMISEMILDVNTCPGNLLTTQQTVVVDDGDTLPPVVSQILLLLQEMSLIDMSPEAGAEDLEADETGPGALVVERIEHDEPLQFGRGTGGW